MNKKTSRIGILLIIAAAVIFVLVDFFRDSSKEEAAREAASQQEQVVSEETDEDVEFGQSDELDEDAEFELSEELEEDVAEESTGGSPVLQYGANKGDAAYDFEMSDIQTGEIVKVSDYRGQKVFLNFWASWCPPCRVEAPDLQSFSENQNEVVVLGVNVTVSESNPENVQGFIDEFGLTFQNFYGPEEMFAPFFVESLPTSFFIDSNGIIQERVTGPVTEDVLNAIFSMID